MNWGSENVPGVIVLLIKTQEVQGVVKAEKKKNPNQEVGDINAIKQPPTQVNLNDKRD